MTNQQALPSSLQQSPPELLKTCDFRAKSTFFAEEKGVQSQNLREQENWQFGVCSYSFRSSEIREELQGEGKLINLRQELMLQYISGRSNKGSMTDIRIASQGSLPRRNDGKRTGKRKIENCTKSDEESFEPEYHLAKKMGYQLNKSKFKVGQWSYQENQVYLQFMLDNRVFFASESSRRRNKVFYLLSKILRKRTGDQCRSHHQKLQIKFKDDLQSIISEVYRKIQKSIAQELVDCQHRFQLPPPCNPFEKRIFQRTAEEECHSQREMHGWVAVVNRENSFRMEVREQQIGVYEGLF